MTLGKRIKQLRTEKGISQERLAEKLNVSRSAIAKWETDGGIPELGNLLQLATIFDVSLDVLAGNMKSQDEEKIPVSASHSRYDFGNKYYDIELEGWNDGVFDVFILAEDEDFLYYQKNVKNKPVYGMIGKMHITSVSPAKGTDTERNHVIRVDRDYFCNKPVMIEQVKREGLLKGFFDFRDDDYRNVVISVFDSSIIRLQFGKEINLSDVTKIEELPD
ncbi:helix-turn-helix domain-containing protein [Robertmurraya massiliosenegalensis]|uniref:helix-turn-helix domain-containing protein n=1 Tax=Robertmurraya massiliosenegalensis TaxID=1287657 RepID=UPI000303384F|nr:helix-turn-helix transcriptional regulator [Robertmurraya massiliosenegalensis]